MRNHLIVAAVIASIALPAFAASSPLLGNMIVTAERVWYDQPVLAPGFSSLITAKPYSQETIIAASSDCSSRGGVLNSCSAMCGLNGCFSTCALACEFPKVIERKQSATIRDYTHTKEKYDDVAKTSKGEPKTKEGIALKKDLFAASAKYADLQSSQESGRALVKKAIAEWQSYIPKVSSEVTLKSARLSELTKSQDALYQRAFSKQCEGGAIPAKLPKNYRIADTGVLSMGCNDAGDQILVRFGSSMAKTYATINVFSGGKWHSVKVGGAVNGWITGGTSAVIGGADDSITAIAVYQCIPRGAAWTCGCTDTACKSPKWQVVGVE